MDVKNRFKATGGEIVPWDSLPEHINEPKEWAGSDWDNWLQWPLLKIKHWFAFGPRSKHKWAAWKSPPCVIFGLGATRWEHLKHHDLFLPKRKVIAYGNTKVLREDGYFPSVVQYWSRGHFLITWPFHISFHVYWPWCNVPPFPGRPGNFTIKKMIYFRFGARYDKDDVFWAPSLFVGGDFN